MKPKEKNGIPFFQASFPASGGRLSNGFFTRRGGVSRSPYDSLNVGPLSDDEPAHRQENLRRISSVLPESLGTLVAARQAHGARVVRVVHENTSRSIFTSDDPFHADALTTDREGIWLGILTADCLPVLFFDPCRRAIGAAHAGWRGTRQRIAARTLQEMTRRYGSRPEDVWVALGPAIGPCCYQVGDEVAQIFLKDYGPHEPSIRLEPPGRWTLDLVGINRRQLLENGVAGERILCTRLCTRCHGDLFFSVRAQGEPTGRQISAIGMPAAGSANG